MTSLSTAKADTISPQDEIQFSAVTSSVTRDEMEARRDSVSNSGNVIDFEAARNRKRQINRAKNAMLLHVMAYMAISDYSLEDTEIAAVCDCYEDFTSEKISKAQVRSLATSYPGLSEAFTSQLQNAGPSLSNSDKENILCAAYFVLLADGTITAQEQCLLRKIAAILKMSEIHYQFVLEDFTEKTASAK